MKGPEDERVLCHTYEVSSKFYNRNNIYYSGNTFCCLHLLLSSDVCIANTVFTTFLVYPNYSHRIILVEEGVVSTVEIHNTFIHQTNYLLTLTHALHPLYFAIRQG